MCFEQIVTKEARLQKNLFQKFIIKIIFVIFPCMMFFMCFFPPGAVSAQQKWLSHDDLFSFNFANENEGWACGRWGTILHTSDGGINWVRQQSSTRFTLASIYFFDSKNGWAVGNEGTILHTTDGGKNWENQKSPVDYSHTSVSFVTPLKGWIASAQTHILYTEDGGKTWKIQFRDVQFKLKSISFADESHGWTVGEYGYIYYTGDGGVTWHHQGGYLRINDETDELEGDTFLYDVLAVDPMTAWAVGLDGLVIKTTEGGKTWLEVHTGAPQTPLFCITNDGANVFVIGGKGISLISEDKGFTWRKPRFEPQIDYSWIYGIARRGSSGFVAGGENGAIYLGTGKDVWKRVSY